MSADYQWITNGTLKDTKRSFDGLCCFMFKGDMRFDSKYASHNYWWAQSLKPQVSNDSHNMSRVRKMCLLIAWFACTHKKCVVNYRLVTKLVVRLPTIVIFKRLVLCIALALTVNDSPDCSVLSLTGRPLRFVCKMVMFMFATVIVLSMASTQHNMFTNNETRKQIFKHLFTS